jgi:hypothetical protein
MLEGLGLEAATVGAGGATGMGGWGFGLDTAWALEIQRVGGSGLDE